MIEKKPKKAPKGKALISVNVPIPVLDKLKHMAHQEGLEFVEVYNRAFVKLIELYEAKHGRIKAQQRGKGLDQL